jgi:Glycosyl transferase family 90
MVEHSNRSMSHEIPPANDFPQAEDAALSSLADQCATGNTSNNEFAAALARYCYSLGRQHVEVRVAFQQHISGRSHLIEIKLEQNRINILCQEWLFDSRRRELFYRLCAVLASIAGLPLHSTHFLADISDGEESGPDRISFCSRDPAAVLIPDHAFVRTRGYETYRHLARANRTVWDERSDWIVWRGLSTGHGAISKTTLSADDPDLLVRVRLCLAMKGVPEADVKLHTIAQSNNLPLDTERLARAGVLGEYVSPIAWCGLKFAIDVDGNTNAWSNFFTRLLMGCCVLKVSSQAGYRQWYYENIASWTHYVPVKPDLSDLRERIAWCRANLSSCRQIAAAGQQFALARDFDGEIAAASRRICAAYARTPRPELG